MKKAISILLAVTAFAFASSAMAASVGDISNRKGTTAFVTDSSSISAMPCFKNGDTVTFDVSELLSGTQLTVISYKVGEDGDADYIQYINEYDLSSTSKTITYTVRDIEPGMYVLQLNGNGFEIGKFYYTVDIGAVLLTAEDAGRSAESNSTAYVMQDKGDGTWWIGFVGKVTIYDTTQYVSDMAPNVGFVITKDGASKKYGFGVGDNALLTPPDMDNLVEVAGSYSFVYGVTMYNVPDGEEDTILAEVTLDANE